MGNVMKYTYQMTMDDCDTICHQIHKWDWKPDLIVGVSRGGLIPAVMLSHRLGVRLEPVTWSTRDWGTKRVSDDLLRQHNYLKNTLIVDDIVDNGDTMFQLKEQLLLARSASLIFNVSQRKAIPDFWGRIINRNVDKDWVDFWWEEPTIISSNLQEEVEYSPWPI